MSTAGARTVVTAWDGPGRRKRVKARPSGIWLHPIPLARLLAFLLTTEAAGARGSPCLGRSRRRHVTTFRLQVLTSGYGVRYARAARKPIGSPADPPDRLLGVGSYCWPLTRRLRHQAQQESGESFPQGKETRALLPGCDSASSFTQSVP